MISREVIGALSQRIIQEFKPLRIVLFGSYARGNATEDSDVDLLVILRFRGSTLRKSIEILNRVCPDFPVDLLARRPGDTRRRYAEWDPLIRDALDHGVVLYERDR
ncbi:MAG: nucleotidyltransferase domain-containing protein [Planctomycetota bacterium]